MPHFFFHFFDGMQREPDEVGLECASSEDAYLKAHEAVREMWSELLAAKLDPSGCAFEIEGSNGELLFRLSFSEVVDELLPRGARRRPETGALRLSLEETNRRAKAAVAGMHSSFAEVRSSIEEANALLRRLGTTAGTAGAIDSEPLPP